MNEKFTKNIINQLFTFVGENENSEEMGANFTISGDKVARSIYDGDIIDIDWNGGSCEYEYAINFRDWTEDEEFMVSKHNDICFFGKSKGDINYYDSNDYEWKFIGNIYEMCTDETKGGITKVKTTEPTEEKTYRIFFPENEIIVNMNKLQYDFCIKLYEETNLFEDNFIDLQDITEITM